MWVYMANNTVYAHTVQMGTVGIHSARCSSSLTKIACKQMQKSHYVQIVPMYINDVGTDSCFQNKH